MKTQDTHKSFVYEKNPIVETICQLRFPAILSIETKLPADFQDAVRESFPRYESRGEKLPGSDTPVTNHNFVSADGRTKLSLTKNFIALSTMRYESWEAFAKLLDEPLCSFIRIYKPAFFERIGLRYLNGFSRKLLELDGTPWRELFSPNYLGVLADPATDEAAISKCAVEVEQKLGDGCNLKLHAGPGSVRRTIRTPEGMQTVQEPEQRFILDADCFSAGNIPLASAAETLERLHNHADRIFSEAITDRLHQAMEPVEV